MAPHVAELRRELQLTTRSARAAPLPLDRRDRVARGVDRLGLRRPLPPSLRTPDLRGTAGVRLSHARRLTARRLRPQHLRRHVQLALRQGLAPRERVPRSQADRDLLLRLLSLHEARARQRREVPAQCRRPWRDARRQRRRARSTTTTGTTQPTSHTNASRTPCSTPSSGSTKSAACTSASFLRRRPRKGHEHSKQDRGGAAGQHSGCCRRSATPAPGSSTATARRASSTAARRERRCPLSSRWPFATQARRTATCASPVAASTAAQRPCATPGRQ